MTETPATDAEASDAGAPPSDAALMAAVRTGDATAFGELYQRHVAAARRLAGALVRDPADAEDLVAETFAKILAALRDGRGPELAFRAYLLTTLRHVCYDRARRDKRLELTDDITRYETGTPFDDTTVADLDRSYAARAFAKLPERWRMVLWHTEVEGETPAQIAPLLGLTPNGVAALAYRARERLRQMYLQEHVATTGDPTCLQTAERLGGYVRGTLGPRERSKVDAHLATCNSCRLLHLELAEVNSGLRGVLAPLVLGGAASAYLSASSAPVTAGVLGALWGAVVSAATWPVRVVRQLAERYGPGNVTAGAGVAGVVAGGLALFIFTLVSNPVPDREPVAEPPPTTRSVPPTTTRLPTTPAPQPPPPPDPRTPPPVPSRPSTSESSSAPPRPVAPAPLEIAPDLVGGGLVSASAGALPVTVRAGKARSEHLQLVAKLPTGVRLSGGDAGDGWRCAGLPAGATCRRKPLAAGRSTTARLPVTVARDVTGFQPVTVAVDAGARRSRASFRVPVAPVGTTVGYAASGRVRMALAGNTLLSCPKRPQCLSGKDNQDQRMEPYVPGPGEPVPPKGLSDPDSAASGAVLDLPSRARIRWAGLYWAAQGRQVANAVTVHGPGGRWHKVTPRTVRGTDGERSLRQAYADVTSLVRGGGRWWLAAPAKSLPSGPGEYAGWTLAVVYEERGASPTDLAVYAGPAALRDAARLAVQAGPRGARVQVGVAIWDGDRGLVGDSLRLGETPLGEPDNVARSVSDSALEREWNTLGVDVATYSARVSGSGQLRLRPGDDPIELGVLAVATGSAGVASSR